MRSSYYHISKDNQAVIIEDGVIAQIVTNEQWDSLQDTVLEKTDLNGLEIQPGIVNYHISLLELSDDLLGMNLQSAKDFDGIAAQMTRVLKSEKSFYVFKNLKAAFSQFVDTAFLDSFSKEVPIVVMEDNGEVWHLNHAAMKLAELDSVTFLEDGKVDAERGTIEGAALEICQKSMPKLELSDIKERILQSVTVCNSLGITEVYTDDLGYPFADAVEILTAYQQLGFQRKLNARIHLDIRYTTAKALASFLDEGITTESAEGLYEIGSILIDLMNPEAELMYQMANSFNMSKRVLIEKEEDFDLAMDLIADNQMEDNLLLDGVIVLYPMKDEHRKKCEEKQLIVIEMLDGTQQVQDGYYGFAVDQNAGKIFRSFYQTETRKEMRKQPWSQSIATGKIACGYAADFFVSERKEDRFAIHFTVVEGKTVFEK